MMTINSIMYMTYIFIISTSTIRASPCGVFEFLTPQCINNTFIVNENSAVNITFTLVNQKCKNKSFDKIDISKKALMTNYFGRQCVIYDTCKSGSFHNNRSCQCLDKSGLYSFTFIATRQDSTLWKWSTINTLLQDSVMEIIVKYPPHVTRLRVEEYDRYIPRHKSVSIFCSWENGNPPSEVRLLDRESNVLTSVNNSGTISYTFHSIDCSHTGTIRCEANGSNKNESIILLVECPPEILIPPPKNRTLYAEQNAFITFPYRSHETHITVCRMTRLNRNQKMEIESLSGVNSFTCTNLSTYLTLGTKFCIYIVTGMPPDLNLTLEIYNLKREDVGLWYVSVSNSIGNDVMYINVDSIDEGNHLSNSGNVTTGPIYNRSTFIEEHLAVSQTLLLPLAVVATMTGCIILYIGKSFGKRGLSRRTMVPFDNSVFEIYMHTENDSPQTDFPGFLIRTISSNEIDVINENVDVVSESEKKQTNHLVGYNK